MREEILRARHNLLTGQDSARVESVIRLLEQTYQHLENEAAATAAIDAVAASLVSKGVLFSAILKGLQSCKLSNFFHFTKRFLKALRPPTCSDKIT